MTYPRHIHIPLIPAFVLSTMMCLSSCETAPETPPAEVTQEDSQQAPAKTPDQRETTVGPVHATVVLDNKNPILGEPITLSLIVDADSEVTVTMPDFGDQMGRFNIADYQASEKLLDDGRYEYIQTYTLDLPMSGKLSTPSFLVEFTDNRADSEKRGKIQEILTEAIIFNVRSVFDEGEVPEDLYPVEASLGELVLPETQKKTPWPIYIAVAAGLILLMSAFLILRKPSSKPAIPADVLALGALDDMEKAEIPTDSDGIDAWYVRLSGIVRTYIEGRFDIHAPRLTTEEFFELAKNNDEIKDEDKLLIRKLLERSDRVKFTDFIPTPEESRQLLADARQFVMDTRIVPDESQPASNSKPSPSDEKPPIAIENKGA